MKRAIKLVIVLAVLLCLSSCTTLRIKMGENSRFTLLPLSAIEGPVDSYQLITGSFPGYENVAMEAWFTCDENDLQLTMFAPTGQTMGKVFYDGKTISFESSFLPKYRCPASSIACWNSSCSTKRIPSVTEDSPESTSPRNWPWML